MSLLNNFNKFKQLIAFLSYGSLKYLVEFDGKMNKYKEAVNMLNTLQSNAAYLKERSYKKFSYNEEYQRTIVQMEKCLRSIGITDEKLNNLSVIHVAGTKGKGSTCAYCESILRQHGYKTGFYSSPHLLEVRERIRINGKPISHEVFAENFWCIYNKLYEVNPNNLPAYFRFLTVMAFDIFLKENVDVAIIEVGIGGEFDCTNVLKRVPVIGITSLGIDHTNILGKSIREIAWHKAGVFKEHSKAYTVPQNDDAMAILTDRSNERKTLLEVIHPFVDIGENGRIIPDAFKLNASLAVALAFAWIKNTKGVNISLGEFADLPSTKRGLKDFTWLGRYQIIYGSRNNYYLDGAHTPESMEICVRWFETATRNSSRDRVLIFNMIGDRDVEKILSALIGCAFVKIYFVPNVSGRSNSCDNKIKDINIHIAKCNAHRNVWIDLLKNNNLEVRESDIVVRRSVSDVVEEISNGRYDCFVTGSLHLMGAALEVLDPESQQMQSNADVVIKNFILNS